MSYLNGAGDTPRSGQAVARFTFYGIVWEPSNGASITWPIRYQMGFGAALEAGLDWLK